MDVVRDEINWNAEVERPDRTKSIESEQSVLGALLIDNNAIDRLGDLKADHFYREDHRTVFCEIIRQITMGLTADVISVYEPLSKKLTDILIYLNAIVGNTTTSANIRRHADIVVGCSVKRAIIALGDKMQELAHNSVDSVDAIVSEIATQIDAIAEKKTRTAPVKMADTLTDYANQLSKRMAGEAKPIATGFADLDHKLDGGLERGTLTVVAARPGMGKTAMGLALCRNVAEWGCAGFLSMEMDVKQVNDRNIAALAGLPISWLRHPDECDTPSWDKLTEAYAKSSALNLYIDDETSLSMLDIRNKARFIKRKSGLDLLVIDQLSFIVGGSREKKTYEVVGEYTRGMIAIAKQLDIAVVLLCQLNRDCENRTNKRPQLSDLAMSGSIEQDAANIIFLYRDEIYNADSVDKGVCEVAVSKQRQGSPGTIVLTYIGAQTRFEDYAKPWHPPVPRKEARSGFND